MLDSIHLPFRERQNCRDGEQIRGFPGLSEEEGETFLEEQEAALGGNRAVLIPDCGGGYQNLYNVLKFIDVRTQKINFIVC